MNLSEACVMIEQQAKWDGVGILELLQTIEQYGIKEYVANAGLTNEFRQAYYIFKCSQPRLDFGLDFCYHISIVD
jgi:hypothetical protein